MLKRNFLIIAVAMLMTGGVAWADDDAHGHGPAGGQGMMGQHESSEQSSGMSMESNMSSGMMMHREKMKKMESMLDSARAADTEAAKMEMMKQHMQAMQEHMKEMQSMMHGSDDDAASGCTMGMSMMQDMMKQMSAHQMMMNGEEHPAQGGKTKRDHEHGGE